MIHRKETFRHADQMAFAICIVVCVHCSWPCAMCTPTCSSRLSPFHSRRDFFSQKIFLILISFNVRVTHNEANTHTHTPAHRGNGACCSFIHFGQNVHFALITFTLSHNRIDASIHLAGEMAMARAPHDFHRLNNKDIYLYYGIACRRSQWRWQWQHTHRRQGDVTVGVDSRRVAFQRNDSTWTGESEQSRRP